MFLSLCVCVYLCKRHRKGEGIREKWKAFIRRCTVAFRSSPWWRDGIFFSEDFKTLKSQSVLKFGLVKCYTKSLICWLAHLPEWAERVTAVNIKFSNAM